MSDTLSTRRGFLRTLAAGSVGVPILARAQRLEAALRVSLGSVTLGDGGPGAVRALRAQYMLADGLTYLNHASIGTVPRLVHEAHVAHLELCESNPSLYVWGSIWREVTETTRRGAAALLGCEADDVAITHSTTEGFNILAAGLPLGPGDEVLFSSLNHPGASVAWERLAQERGFTVRRFEFPVERGAELDAAAVVAIHEAEIGPATRVLVFPHVDNIIGVRHPLAALATMAKRAGVEFVAVDGAQSAGMVPVSLGESGVDAYAMSPHKWIQSPKGLGLFYAGPAVRSVLRPLWFRGGISEGPTARRYEDYSTRAWPAVVALGDALAFQAALGQDEKVRRYRALWRMVRERVDADARLAWRSPGAWDDGSMIMAVEPVGRSAPALGGWLYDEHGISVRAFGGAVNTLRISPNVSTTDQEIHGALDLVAEGGP